MEDERIAYRHDKAVDIVIAAQKKLGVEETFRRLIQFMISYLSLMRNSLPEVAQRALSVSEKFSAGLATSEDMEVARHNCWNHLESIGAMYDFDSRDALSIRAVLCTLTADPNRHDLIEFVEWFLQFADSVEDHSLELPKLLEMYF